MKGETRLSMHLYLLRHGVAEEARPGLIDADRALTSDGRKKLRQVLRAVAEARVKPSLMLSSHLKRAVQTAEIAKEVLAYDGEIVKMKSLAPAAAAEQVWEEIRIHKSEPALMLVGHNPLFDYLAAFLLGAQNLKVDFKKGAIMRIDLEAFGPQPRGILCWYLTAKLSASRE
jgi:phosphohistidine phosphatase